jgi:predicted aspartyl protease
MGNRRAVAAGLTASALFSPSLVRAQVFDPKLLPPSLLPNAVPMAPTDAPSGMVVRAAADPFDRMTVPVKVNGFGPFPFVVDTGSNRSVVSDVLANQLNLPMSEVLRVHSATGVVATGSVHVDTLSVGRRHISNITAPVLTAANLGALGMLGIDAVADQRIVMDFRRQRMTLTTGVRSEDSAGVVVVRARSKYGQLLLVDSWVEGIPLYVIIDTGGEMTIGNLTMRRMLARRRSGYPEPVKVTSVTGETITADLSFLPKVRLGNIGMSNLQIAYADMYAFEQFGLQDKPSMLLGMSTLRLFERVSIDFPAREVRFNLGDI